ncbi:MAG TPA: polysaccharide deacetylase family protein [Thermoanaerobaculia bacterium]|nr:polysaccharide deacetylase family protein [Thermoanaerobaculia bacterium]
MSGPAELLFFWDYDTQWGGDRSRLPGGPKEWGALEFANTERLLELHAEHEVPACFAVVGSAALAGDRPYHDPAQIRRIHAAGHEIGSHSHRHEWLPGLGAAALRETLASSKNALEQCIGAPVATFVPPWNQPFDYPGGFSFSLSERRHGGADRTDLGRLCETLRETGYRFCRVAYRPMHQRLAEIVVRRRLDQKGRIEKIRGIACARLNTPGGFARRTVEVLRRSARRGGLVVVYGHPHSLTLGNSQDERHLAPFLQLVSAMCKAGELRVTLPREWAGNGAARGGLAEGLAGASRAVGGA